MSTFGSDCSIWWSLTEDLALFSSSNLFPDCKRSLLDSVPDASFNRSLCPWLFKPSWVSKPLFFMKHEENYGLPVLARIAPIWERICTLLCVTLQKLPAGKRFMGCPPRLRGSCVEWRTKTQVAIVQEDDASLQKTLSPLFLTR